MAEIITLSILLVLIYQFDEVVRVLYLAVSKARHKRYKDVLPDTDQLVGTALGLAVMPFLLNYLVTSDKSLLFNLMVLGCLLLGFSVAAVIAGFFTRKFSTLPHYHNMSALVSASYSVAAVFAPVLRMMPSFGGRAGKQFAKLAFFLSLPVLFGMLISIYFSGEQFSSYMDILIVVMIAGAFMHFTANFLKSYVYRNRIDMMGLFRIAFGLGVAFVMILRS
jgi:hypothetical protein